jgi:NitT/TauT family transport system substrate-binding protein
MELHSRVRRVRSFLCLAAASLSMMLSGFASAQTLAPVSVELGDVSLTKLPFVVAAENGIYERNGLKVTQFISPLAAELIRQSSGLVVPKENVRTGASDINIGGGSPTIVRMTTNAHAPQRVILATTESIARFHVITRGDIRTLDDLKGKRIGFSTPGSLSHLALLQLFEKMGWDPKRDVSMFERGADVKDLASRKVDAFAADVIAFDEAMRAGLYDLVDLSTFEFPIPGSGVNADKAWLATHRDTAARFVKATIDAVAFMKANKEATFQAMRKWYGIDDPQRQEAIYREVARLPMKPYPSVAGLQKMIDVYDWREMRLHKPADFYDDSFVAELDRSGYIDALGKQAK